MQFHLCHCTDHCRLASQKGQGGGSKGEKEKVEGSLRPQCLPAPTPATHFLYNFIFSRVNVRLSKTLRHQLYGLSALILTTETLSLFRSIVSTEFYFYVNSSINELTMHFNYTEMLTTFVQENMKLGDNSSVLCTELCPRDRNLFN